MEAAALGLAIVALLAVLIQRSKLAALSDELAQLRAKLDGGAGSDLEERVGLNTKFLAQLCAGASPSPEQVTEGRLWSEVSPEQGQALVEKGVRVIDVRTPQETAAGIIPEAIQIPVDQLPQRFGEIPRDGKETLVYCAMGVRSAAACQFLAEQGYESLVNLDGGFTRWAGPKVQP